MKNRKKTIEEIMANFHAMKNKLQLKAIGLGAKDRITHSQWFVLCIIEANKNMGIKDISKMLSISASAATQLVDGLTENGYVKRKTDQKDHRFLHINLSPKGQKVIATTRKKHIEVMGKLFGALTDAELGQYLALHKKILNKIQHEN
ncbi:MarR family transcriptional regulator [Candidatus Parcubacteria bacterium]|nr:MarR family transcriptional regulator [Candidatus Parcubacteria bacterium]